MTPQVQSQTKGLPPIRVESQGVTLPTFNVLKLAGRTPLDDLATDMILVPKLYRMRVPAALHLRDKATAALLQRAVKDVFSGRKGTWHLLQVPLANTAGAPNRYIMLVGNGLATSYTGKTSCQTFEIFLRKAIELGVETVTVPFTPNPMTKNALTHRATAYKLKSVVAKIFAELSEQPRLREIQIYCHPAARASIQEGLNIEHGEECCCIPG